MAGQLLTCLARLFNSFLQMRGFTMGVEDILVKDLGNMRRLELLSACDVSGMESAILAFGLTADCSVSDIESAWRTDHFSRDSEETLKRLDLVMNKKTNDCQDCIKKLIMPEKDEDMPGELLRVFPRNNLQMMFLSGAKGTQVNCVQISCTLGQISLEGRRPPLMLSGASLPSFEAYDLSPRAGGFVAGRFLTGLRPQEYFFHCMAGREGLVDTAVKTSHSGYLQRCLIKHLEGLTVAYDMTVRDSDGSVIQFLYGEDGLDVMKTSFLKRARPSDKFPQFPFLIANNSSVLSRHQLREISKKTNTEAVAALKHTMSKWKARQAGRSSGQRSSCFLDLCAMRNEDKASLISQWRQLSEDKKRSLLRKCRPRPDPVNSQLRSDRFFGSISEYLDELIDSYMMTNPDQMLYEKSHHRRLATTLAGMKSDGFRNLLHFKYQNSLVAPGEAVGLLAAQSIGEPSTQMTLNTFHFAGHQAMNVTLGIPRLREILMTGSVAIKTPIMQVPVFNNPTAHKQAERIAKKLTSVSLSAVLKKLTVNMFLAADGITNLRANYYKVHFEFHRRRVYRDWSVLTPTAILNFIEKNFLLRLSYAIEKHIRETQNSTLLNTTRVFTERASALKVAGDDDGTDNAGAVDGNNDDDDDDDRDDDRDDDKDDDKDYDDGDEKSEQSCPSDTESGAEEANDDKDDEVDENSDENQTTDFTHQLDHIRIQKVTSRISSVCDYTYDTRHESWCTVTFKYPVLEKSIDVTSVVEHETNKAVVYQTLGIKRASATRRKDDKDLMLRTEGLNIQEMYKYGSVFDLNRLYTNSIHTMALHYGIEAAYQAIIKEVSSVFELYKITVDRRHLSLIADYMTYEGAFKPFNRLALESNTSPLQKMTFETSMHFLQSALIEGATDSLNSPSARIIVGRVMKAGTGYMDTIVPVATV